MEIEFCRRQHAKDTAKANEAGGGAKNDCRRRREELRQEVTRRATAGGSTKSYCGRPHKKLRQEAVRKTTAKGDAKSYGGESDAGGAIICQHCLSLLDSLIQQRLL